MLEQNVTAVQECIPVGCGRCVPSAVVAMSIPACTGLGGVCIPACTGQGGVCLGGVSARGGVSAHGGVSQHALGQTPPCEQNDRQV